MCPRYIKVTDGPTDRRTHRDGRTDDLLYQYHAVHIVRRAVDVHHAVKSVYVCQGYHTNENGIFMAHGVYSFTVSKTLSFVVTYIKHYPIFLNSFAAGNLL